jgi:hypothetical protein
VEQPDSTTTIGLADFACVPMPGLAGFGVSLGQLFAGAWRWTHYDHVLLYDGWWPDTPSPNPLQYLVPDSRGELGPGHYVFEAMPHGARRRKLDGLPEQIEGALWSTGIITLTLEQRYNIRNQVTQRLGTPYSAADYFAIGLHRLHIPAPGLRDYIEDDGHEQCAQLVDTMYDCAGEHLFTDGRWPGYVDPWDMAHRLLAGQLPEI